MCSLYHIAAYTFTHGHARGTLPCGLVDFGIWIEKLKNLISYSRIVRRQFRWVKAGNIPAFFGKPRAITFVVSSTFSHIIGPF
jgi:hypothetical protein